MPTETMAWIDAWQKEKEAAGGRVEVLVIDSLLMTGKHNTHFTLPYAAEMIRKVKPKKAFLVGMSCDSFPPHKETNALLKEMFEKDGDIEVQLARDGLTVDVDL